MIDLSYLEGAFSAEAHAQLVEQLTGALIRNEGAPDNERTRALTWVFSHELPAAAISVAGAPVDRPVYRVLITVPAGTLLHGPGPVGFASRRNLVREVTELVLAAEGSDCSTVDAGRVYCVVREVEDGYWGALATTWRIEDIASIATDAETPLGAQAREAIDALLATRAPATTNA
jgi:phenylpyruvate tautomerase PptA (4-oxalocrotonate tautomerase family)